MVQGNWPHYWRQTAEWSSEIVSEYDQEIPQSQTADTPWHREEEPLNNYETTGRQIKQSNQLSLPHQVRPVRLQVLASFCDLGNMFSADGGYELSGTTAFLVWKDIRGATASS